ncbi:MAG: DoxX family protein [Pirellulaceae bacterium]
MITIFTRFQFWLFVVAIVALRVAVGIHFYTEGKSKLEAKTWTAQGFLKSATGPLKDHFHQMLEDADGKMLLGIDEASPGSTMRYQLYPTLTRALWKDFADQATEYYDFGGSDFIDQVKKRIELRNQTIADAAAEKTKPVDKTSLELANQDDLRLIPQIQQQIKQLDEIVERHVNEFESWQRANEIELLAYFQEENRVEGFERDGDARQKIANEVDSIGSQVNSIQSDRNKKIAGWRNEVTAIWDSFENSVNDLRLDKQLSQTPIQLHRPFDQKFSQIKWIDRIVPWFDFMVGISLILGLFSRYTSLLAGLFLLAIIATQPPWIANATPTFNQMVEMFSLFVLSVVGAGRFFGIDYFFSTKLRQVNTRSNPATSRAATGLSNAAS